MLIIRLREEVPSLDLCSHMHSTSSRSSWSIRILFPFHSSPSIGKVCESDIFLVKYFGKELLFGT